MVCIGTGPGPKNVLVEFADGSQMCVPYAIYKHKITHVKEFTLPDKEYATAAGFVQFEVNEREANNQTVRDVVIKQAGSQQYIRITLWPEFENTIVTRGDFVAVDGVFTRSTYQTEDGEKKTSLQISARSLFVGGQAERVETERVSASDSGAEAGDLF